MKTIKVLLSIAGLVTTSLCFGQLFSETNHEELYYTAYYDISSQRMEHHIDHFPTRGMRDNYYDMPLLKRTYFVPLEYDIPVEPWMTSPFETNYYEPEIPVEPWMETPFESGIYEAALEVEAWMTRPFTLDGQMDSLPDEEIEVEDWMSTPWI